MSCAAAIFPRGIMRFGAGHFRGGDRIKRGSMRLRGRSGPLGRLFRGGGQEGVRGRPKRVEN